MHQLGWYRRTFGPFVGSEGSFYLRGSVLKRHFTKQEYASVQVHSGLLEDTLSMEQKNEEEKENVKWLTRKW